MLKAKTSMATLVQYVVMRHDIAKDMQWPLGAVIAQACHATTAVMEEFKDDPVTIEYLRDIENMHKVVLQVPNESALMKAAAALEDNDIKHVLWIEKPENLPTCIAIKPYDKEVLKPILGSLGDPWGQEQIRTKRPKKSKS